VVLKAIRNLLDMSVRRYMSLRGTFMDISGSRYIYESQLTNSQGEGKRSLPSGELHMGPEESPPPHDRAAAIAMGHESYP